MGFLPLALPFAELEVGQHLYWQLGNLKIHGQVFLSSWVVIGALLAFVLVGSRKMERDPRGMQNLLEFLWDYIRDLAREQIGEKAYRDWLPFIGTLFLFIFVCNWGGALVPRIPLLRVLRGADADHAPVQNHRRLHQASVAVVPSVRKHPG